VSTFDIPRNYPEWQDAAIYLLRGPVFEHDGDRWNQVTNGRGEINSFVRQIGLRVIVDTIDGFAYLEQLPADELGDRPRLIKKRTLSLPVTIYGVFLRQELDRAIKDDPALSRVKRTYRQIRDLVAEFFPPSNNESADRRLAMSYLNELVEMGFLKKASAASGPEEEFELTRFLRAKFNPAATQDLTDRVRKHLKITPNDDNNGSQPEVART
jgi:hypothetical protein